MIKTVEGNLMKASETVIAHQVNCQGVMGSGVARDIRFKFPRAYERYIALCRSNKKAGRETSHLLGLCQVVESEGKYIANLFGQDFYGMDRQHTDYSALTKAFSILADQCEELKVSIAMPYGIGCGRGGGDWSTVYRIIERLFRNCDVTLYKL